MRKYFKLNTVINVIDRVLSWRSKGVSNEDIKPPITLIMVLIQNKSKIYRKLFKTIKFYVYL